MLEVIGRKSAGTKQLQLTSFETARYRLASARLQVFRSFSGFDQDCNYNYASIRLTARHCRDTISANGGSQMATELGGTQVSSLMETLPGIASVLRSPVADALSGLIRASIRSAELKTSDVEELMKYATRRGLMADDEANRLVAEVVAAQQKKVEKAAEREAARDAKAAAKPVAKVAVKAASPAKKPAAVAKRPAAAPVKKPAAKKTARKR